MKTKTLKQFIAQCGSMEKAAFKMGVSYSTMFRVSHGKKPSDMFVKVAALMGVKI